MGNGQSQIDELREEAKNMEEAFDQYTRKENQARAREEREREARHKKELEQLAKQMKQMDIDRQKREDEKVRAKEERRRNEKENELKIREDMIKLEKLRAEEEAKKRMENIAKLRAEIRQIKPGGSFEFPEEDLKFPKRLNIGLYGATGIGKTSLMNSLKFAMNGELKGIQREQAAPEDFQGGHTTRRMAVRITQYLTFVDNRGVGAEDLVKDDAADELIIQLEGRRSFATIVDWGKSSPPDDIEEDETQKIYCTVLVFSARSVAATHTIVGKFVERLLKWQGRFPLAVITHVDDATPAELDNMRLALKMAGIVDVYEVANITDNKENLEPVYQENLLKLLHKCIKDGDRIFQLRHAIELKEKKKGLSRNKLDD